MSARHKAAPAPLAPGQWPAWLVPVLKGTPPAVDAYPVGRKLAQSLTVGDVRRLVAMAVALDGLQQAVANLAEPRDDGRKLSSVLLDAIGDRFLLGLIEREGWSVFKAHHEDWADKVWVVMNAQHDTVADSELTNALSSARMRWCAELETPAEVE